MEEASGFMTKIMEYPVAECGEPLISLKSVVEESAVEVEFASSKVAKDYERLFYLRKGLINNFTCLAREMNNRGWVLIVEDAYRTRDMQKYLALKENVFDTILRRVIWECHGKIPGADLMFRRMSALTAVVPKVGTHMSGSALDISVLYRDSRKKVDRGGHYLELSELTPMQSPFISAGAGNNRMEITKLMKRYGFTAYPYEFWHYSSGDGYAEYLTESHRKAWYGPVDWNSETGEVTAVENANEPLHKPEDIKREIIRAMKRAENGKSLRSYKKDG
jgi:D-alanyl-D-alanine dipeptidase